MPGPVTTDKYGHLVSLSGPTVFAAAANGVTTAGTIAVATAGSGAGSSVVIPATSTPSDARGVFSITGAGSPAAGIIAHVSFAQPYSSIPPVVVNVTNASNVSIPSSAASVTVNGFDIYATAAISASAGNTCSYFVPGGGNL
jgi:hypothetical protein